MKRNKSRLNSPEYDRFLESSKSLIDKHILTEEVTPIDRRKEVIRYTARIAKKLLGTDGSVEQISFYAGLLSLMISGSMSKDVRAMGLVEKLLNSMDTSSDEDED